MPDSGDIGVLRSRIKGSFESLNVGYRVTKKGIYPYCTLPVTVLGKPVLYEAKLLLRLIEDKAPKNDKISTIAVPGKKGWVYLYPLSEMADRLGYRMLPITKDNPALEDQLVIPVGAATREGEKENMYVILEKEDTGILIVDDVFSEGQTAIDLANGLKGICPVHGAYAMWDRGEGVDNIRNELGIECDSVCRMVLLPNDGYESMKSPENFTEELYQEFAGKGHFDEEAFLRELNRGMRQEITEFHI